MSNVLSYKAYCLPLSKSKLDKLKLMCEEYTNIYNYVARFLPSLPKQYYENTNPSKMYTKYIKSKEIEYNLIGSREAFNAIKDACTMYKSAVSNGRKGVISSLKPNYIKFDKSRYIIIKIGDKYGVAIGNRLKGKYEIFIPIEVGTYSELIEHLNNIIESTVNPGVIVYNLLDNSISIPRKEGQLSKFKKKS